MNVTTTTHRAKARISLALALAAAAATPALADTYTWTGGTGAWSSENWTANGASTTWVDGNDAVINNNTGSKATITVSGSPSVGNLQTQGNKEIELKGSGASLSISGTVTPLVKTTISVPITGANALTVGGNSGTTSALYLNAANTYSGGTFLLDGAKGGSTFSPSSDSALGAVPATPQDNIFIAGKTLQFYTTTAVSLDANRQILVRNGGWLKLRSTNGKLLTVNGRIHGETTGGLDYPTNTHFVVQQNNSGTVVLNSGSAVTNDLGTLSVRGKLVVSNGVYRLSSGIANAIDSYNGDPDGNGTSGNGGSSLGFVRGGSSGTSHTNEYSAAHGQLFVEGGEIITPEAELPVPLTTDADANRNFVAMEYATVEIRSKVNMPNVKYLNGRDTPATLTIGEGGDLTLAALEVSGNATHSVVNVQDGGILRLVGFMIGNPGSGNQAYPATINLDGGEIHRIKVVAKSGGSDNPLTKADIFLGENSSRWTNTTVNVKAGGAIFVADGGQAVFTRIPLRSGVAHGETDGGLTVRGGKEFVFLTAGSDYNGPTRIEGAQLMQIRVANALPPGTTVQLASGARISFNTYASSDATDVEQTVARVEGVGEVRNNSLLTVTGGIAPVFDGNYGILTFDKTSTSLGGTLEISGDANGCGCVKFNQTQSIAGLTLKMMNPQAFATDKGKSFYKVVDGPYTGSFAATDLPPAWGVNYENGAVYLRHIDATVISVR